MDLILGSNIINVKFLKLNCETCCDDWIVVMQKNTEVSVG